MIKKFFFIAILIGLVFQGEVHALNEIDSLDHTAALAALETYKTENPFGYWAKKGDLYALNNQTTEAIICYETARLFNSGSSAINKNLEICYSKTTNAAKELMIDDLNSFRHKFFNPKSSNFWAFSALIFWLIFIFSVLRIVGFKKPLAKFWLFSGVLAFILSVLAYNSLNKGLYAIVTQDSTGCKMFTVETAENFSVVNAGYKLEIIEFGEDWCRVRLATNKAGWVQTRYVEIIQKK